MKLTRLQRKTLQFFDTFRSATPTVGRQLRFNWFAWLPLLAVIAVAVVVAFIPGLVNVGLLWIGLAVGALSRDIGRFRGLARVWPVYKEIINWERVSVLLQSSEKHDA